MPFVKNRYFYGKLLTAEDFEQEQRYADDRRRMVNRWMLGVGVAAGLEVIRVDDYNISVEMGLAFDYAGREIVVDAPVIIKLSALDGYEEATKSEGNEILYLCIEYAQTPIEPVHNITDRAIHTIQEEAYNKYREDYHLFVTNEEPKEINEFEGCLDTVRFICDRAEKIHRGTYQTGICLARIELVKAGTFYMIDRTLPMPAEQYAFSQSYTVGMLRVLRKELEQKTQKNAPPEIENRQSGGVLSEQERDWQFAQGMVTIAAAQGGKQGRCVFSEETPHGLGPGDVEIMLHVVQGNFSYSGMGEIFDEYEQKAEAAARLDRNMGTFTVGIRFLEDCGDREITVGWTAIRKRSRNEIREKEERVYIRPGLVQIKTREQVKLEAVCVNMEEAELLWNVVKPDGGAIGEDGMYHAPNTPGVYEVTCSKKGNSNIKASVFVIVRE